MDRLNLTLVMLLALSIAFGQSVNFGLKVGVPFTNSFEELTTNPKVSSPLRRYTLGATAEVRFRSGFGFELDTIYKRIGYSERFFCGLRCPPNVISMNPEIISEHESDIVVVKGNAWEFPVLAKYRFRAPLHPFLASGPSVRHIVTRLRCVSDDSYFGSGVPGGTRIFAERPCYESPPRPTFAGYVVSAGIEIHRDRLRLVPEFRYTHWFENEPWKQIRLLPADQIFIPDQTEFLLGIIF
jgi:outer membrane protein with beta-barrel domain